jgi:hypothetical protein
MLDEAGAAWSSSAPRSRMTSLQGSANEPPWQLDRLGESGFVMITLNRGAADVYGGRALVKFPFLGLYTFVPWSRSNSPPHA